MSTKRKQYKPEFKAKVALSAIRGDETTAQLSGKFGIHGTMISSWKRNAMLDFFLLLDQTFELQPKFCNPNSGSLISTVSGVFGAHFSK